MSLVFLSESGPRIGDVSGSTSDFGPWGPGRPYCYVSSAHFLRKSILCWLGRSLTRVCPSIVQLDAANPIRVRFPANFGLGLGQDWAGDRPLGFGRIVAEAACTIKNGADLGTAEWEAEVAGVAGVDGVDRESAGLGGSLGENLCLHNLCWFSAAMSRQ